VRMEKSSLIQIRSTGIFFCVFAGEAFPLLASAGSIIENTKFDQQFSFFLGLVGFGVDKQYRIHYPPKLHNVKREFPKKGE
jgi:hypothetical protein